MNSPITKFWYVVFLIHESTSTLSAVFSIADEEFLLGLISQVIEENYKNTVVILSWKEISAKQVIEYQTYFKGDKNTHLRLV